jgi:glycosyltransferase involved in cell wall biosynthesis
MSNLELHCNPPKISVVIACLNADKTIERTLRSLREQDYPNLELIVVDGFSTDRTMEIVHRHGPIVSRIICEKDHGVAEAINKGFRCATGDIRCYLNADDCFVPGALHRIAQEFVASPEIDVITGGCQRVFADGSTLVTQVPEHFERLMALRNDIEQPSTFWRTSIHRKAGELNESYSLAFDWEWWNRLRRCGARFKVVRDVLSVYYFTDDNLTSKAGMRVVNEMYCVTKAYGPCRGLIADIYRLLFHWFDLKEYYDRPFPQLSAVKRFYFGTVLRLLYTMCGREVINAYNWNWASKQIRGVTWYK